jgi:two-component system, sensor histidine kinase
MAAGFASAPRAAPPVPAGGADDAVDILLVDDRPENLLALEAILEPLGEHLVKAPSGDDALKYLLKQDFACILLDVQMPGLNGFETAQLIKSRERTRYIPIIFLTAISTDEQYVFQGYQVGAVDYMAKPFQPDVLRSKVAVFVELYRKQRQIARQERLLRTAELRELELQHRTEMLETQGRMMAELQALNEELHARQAELEHAMTARNRFYASMSHELRTPINAIIGYNTLLLDNIYGPLNEKQMHGIQRAHKAAKHLLELVNDVLDLSKIEAGKIELSLQPVSIPALIEDLFVTVRPLADEHEAKLAMTCESDDIHSVVSDPRRVRQVLLNLLSNAIKFGGGAKPIEVRVANAAAGGVTVSVTDHGVGIAPDDLPRIFDEFVQLSNSQQFGGTGLGLPISKRLAVILGGDLTAASTLGAGSTFTLTLPRESGAPVPASGEKHVETPIEVPAHANADLRVEGPSGTAGGSGTRAGNGDVTAAAPDVPADPDRRARAASRATGRRT